MDARFFFLCCCCCLYYLICETWLQCVAPKQLNWPQSNKLSFDEFAFSNKCFGFNFIIRYIGINYYEISIHRTTTMDNLRNLTKNYDFVWFTYHNFRCALDFIFTACCLRSAPHWNCIKNHLSMMRNFFCCFIIFVNKFNFEWYTVEKHADRMSMCSVYDVHC